MSTSPSQTCKFLPALDMGLPNASSAALGVKLGHRRTLFRQIATLRGTIESIEPWTRKLRLPGHPQAEPLDESHQSIADHVSSHSVEDNRRFSVSAASGSECFTSSSAPAHVVPQKRRYKRHPKPDENAPPRPASAYVLFANQVREQQKDSDLNFAQLARLVGDRWKNLAPMEKEAIESKAAEAKKQYNCAVSNYKKSHEYALYQDYLVEFKERALKDEKPEKLEPPKRYQRVGDTELGFLTQGAPRPVDIMVPNPSAISRPLVSISSILRDPGEPITSASRLPPPIGYTPEYVGPVTPESYSRHSHLTYPLPMKPLIHNSKVNHHYKYGPNQFPRLTDDRGVYRTSAS